MTIISHSMSKKENYYPWKHSQWIPQILSSWFRAATPWSARMSARYQIDKMECISVMWWSAFLYVLGSYFSSNSLRLCNFLMLKWTFRANEAMFLVFFFFLCREWRKPIWVHATYYSYANQSCWNNFAPWWVVAFVYVNTN